MLEEKYYNLVKTEIEEIGLKQPLWKKALIECNGNELKARELYVELRAFELMKNFSDSAIGLAKPKGLTLNDLLVILFVTIFFFVLVLVINDIKLTTLLTN